MSPCWKRSIRGLFNDQISIGRENQPAFPVHLHHFHVHLQAVAKGQEPAQDRLRDEASNPNPSMMIPQSRPALILHHFLSQVDDLLKGKKNLKLFQE